LCDGNRHTATAHLGKVQKELLSGLEVVGVVDIDATISPGNITTVNE